MGGTGPDRALAEGREGADGAHTLTLVGAGFGASWLAWVLVECECWLMR